MNFLRGLLRSNTVQFNVIYILTILAGLDFIRSNPDYLAIVVGLQSIVNIILRIKTNSSISER